MRLTNWPDLILEEVPSYEAKKYQTKKATETQKEIINLRDGACVKIDERFLTYLKDFHSKKTSSMTEADRWKKCWENSIVEVKMLYSG